MPIRKLLMAAMAATVPLGLVLVSPGASSAAPVPGGTGSVTCSVSGDVTFAPPLTYSGVTQAREVVQFNIAASGCSGGSPGQDTAAITVKPIKPKNTLVDGQHVAGACGTGPNFNPTLLLKTKIVWSGQFPVKDTLLTLGPLGSTMVGSEAGFTGTGTAKKSYAGPSSIALAIEPASVDQVGATCKDNTPGSSVPELDFDGTMSSITIG
jgi:hypothetical protein